MLYAVIMAGGSGTRFWPAGRKCKPKQLLKILGEKTMIRATVDRLRPCVHVENIMVVANVLHYDGIRLELPELADSMIVCEPYARNTAPCIALAAYKLAGINPNALMAVLPADHLIGPETRFRELLNAAATLASSQNSLITFGILPDKPETGYGYIEIGEKVYSQDGISAHRATKFVEKPDRRTAQFYLDSGNFLWNSGMFVFSVSAIIEAFDRHLPEVSSVIKEIGPFLNSHEESEAIRRAYQKVAGISVDYGIMERADNVLVIPADLDWNDVGSWGSLDSVWGRDENGHVSRGELISLLSKRCVVDSGDKLVALIGVEDLVVVDTPDALLICRKDMAQEVRNLQKLLMDHGRDDLL
jgi:mannose-1-phosphate guanylyltransferase